jgi:hypothetical protein
MGHGAATAARPYTTKYRYLYVSLLGAKKHLFYSFFFAFNST